MPQGGSALRTSLSPEALTNGLQAGYCAAGWHGVQKLRLPVLMSQPHSSGGVWGNVAPAQLTLQRGEDSPGHSGIHTGQSLH